MAVEHVSAAVIGNIAGQIFVRTFFLL